MEESANPFELAAAGIAYGDAGFVNQICQRVRQTGSQDDLPAIRLLQKAATAPSIDAVRSAVKSAFPDASQCQTRRYLVWALHTCTWLKGCEIGHAVGLKRSAISEILRGVELRRLADKQTATRLAAVEEQLQYISSAVVLPTRQLEPV